MGVYLSQLLLPHVYTGVLGIQQEEMANGIRYGKSSCWFYIINRAFSLAACHQELHYWPTTEFGKQAKRPPPLTDCLSIILNCAVEEI
jgi:hypothetical protein